MFRLGVVAGTVDVSVPIMVVDSGDGTPETGYAHDTTGIDMWYRRMGGSEVSITEAALAAWNTAHTDGGVEHGSNGRGRLDLPDAACAIGTDGAKYCEYGGHIDGMVVIGGVVELIDPVGGLFTSFAIGATGNTTTALHVSALGALADDELIGELIWVMDVSAGEWHPAWITDYANTGDLATVVSARDGGALPFTPEASVDRVWRSGISRAQFVVPSVTGAVGSVAGNVSGDVVGSVGSVTAGVTLANDAITSAKFDESTAFPLRSNNLNLSAAGIITGTAATGTLSTTVATSSLTGYANDQLIGRILVVTSGDAAGEATDITDYAETNGTLTFTALTTAMANNDTFVIV